MKRTIFRLFLFNVYPILLMVYLVSEVYLACGAPVNSTFSAVCQSSLTYLWRDNRFYLTYSVRASLVYLVSMFSSLIFLVCGVPA